MQIHNNYVNFDLIPHCADRLCQSLMGLEGCLSSGRVFSLEKTWASFVKCRDDIVTAVESAIHHISVSTFLVHQTMEFLINASSTSSTVSSSSSANEKLTEEEKDILTYVGGYVLFRAKRFFSGKAQHLAVVSKGTKKDVSSKLIRTKTRGGLCEPVDDMISFFELCEVIFRNLFGNCSLTLFVDHVCSDVNALSLFLDSTCCHESEENLQEEIMLYVLKVFYTTSDVIRSVRK